MRVRKSRRSRERGAAIFESMAALTVLCLLFFALLQIFYWCIQTQFCEYAAFYASKSVALGYRPNFCLRAARGGGHQHLGAAPRPDEPLREGGSGALYDRRRCERRLL